MHYDFLLNTLHTAMNVLVQIYDSQTIICKKKLLNIKKNILRLTRVQVNNKDYLLFVIVSLILGLPWDVKRCSNDSIFISTAAIDILRKHEVSHWNNIL